MENSKTRTTKHATGFFEKVFTVIKESITHPFTTSNIPIEEIHVEIHGQLDGGAILEGVVTDSQGKTHKQDLHVSMSDRQKFGDKFLIEGFKADIQAGENPFR